MTLITLHRRPNWNKKHLVVKCLALQAVALNLIPLRKNSPFSHCPHWGQKKLSLSLRKVKSTVYAVTCLFYVPHCPDNRCACWVCLETTVVVSCGPCFRNTAALFIGNKPLWVSPQRTPPGLFMHPMNSIPLWPGAWKPQHTARPPPSRHLWRSVLLLLLLTPTFPAMCSRPLGWTSSSSPALSWVRRHRYSVRSFMW